MVCVLALYLLVVAAVLSTGTAVGGGDVDKSAAGAQLFTIEGRATLKPGEVIVPNWHTNAHVLVDYGKYIGFVREDGNFVVEGVPSGSYVVEVANVEYIFEPVRVDITSKGKTRARRLNLLQPNAVSTLPYPLQLVARQPTRYFRPREEWRVTDMLMNPMVIMLVVAFVLLIVTPKLASSDPELQKEMQNVQMPKMDMDMADMFASFFGGGKSGGTKKKGTARAIQSQHHAANAMGAQTSAGNSAGSSGPALSRRTK